MPTSLHTFLRANTDDSDEQRPGTDFVAAVNLHLEPGQVFPATGNVRVPGLVPPAGTTLGLGGLPDGSTGTAIHFYYNSAGAHRLVRYDPLGSAGAGSETVLLEWAGLNLSPALTIQGVVLEKLLVYLDAAGEIRCINLARAAAGGYGAGYLAAEPFALHLVKVPPRQALAVDTLAGTTGAAGESLRIIQSRAYQFSYRYRYDDGEVTVLAPYSGWLDVLTDPATAPFNTIRLTLPPLPAGVQEVELLTREPETLTWQVLDTVRRVGGTVPATYNFYGQLFGGTLVEAEAGRLFEALWPCKAIEAARSRIFAADLLEGYLTPEPAFTATVVNYPTTVGINNLNPATFHENCTYRITAQFYDAFGRPGGCSQPRTVRIPPQNRSSLAYRRVRIDLTTTAGLNNEIPAWAQSVQFLVAPNDRTPHFIQGRVADVHAFFGIEKKPDSNGTVQESVSLDDIVNTPHQQVAVNIGNFVASGQGYVWQPGSGDIIRYPDENQEFLITGQYGDYLIHNWTGQPNNGRDGNGYHSNVRVEIYSPNTNPLPSYYERGPVIPIVRSVVGGQPQRAYAQTSVELFGDAFLVPFFFPVVARGGSPGSVYDPPSKVRFRDDPTPVLVESMVPPYRLAPTRTTTTTQTGATFLNNLAAADPALAGFLGVGKATAADTANRTSANLRWLDMKAGGRPGEVIPLALQQVRRNIERFSGQKQQGNLINGLSRWEALNQYDKFPQEQGNITALVLADQSQTDGSVLLALQERGIVSQYLSQQPIKTGADSILIATADQVIGGDNTLRGGLGCTDPASVVSYAGKVFYWSREHAELVRYNSGLTPLGETYKFRTRLRELTNYYGPTATVSGCFDPRRQEYWLTFRLNDLLATTVVWSERRQAWSDSVSWQPEAGLGVGNELVTWRNGALYRHTPDAPVGQFGGIVTPPSITFVAAQPGGGLAKTWQSISVRSQAQWVPTLLTTPAGQQSRILPTWQRPVVKGVWRATVRRDENTAGPQSLAQKLSSGRVLQSESLRVTLTCPEENPAPLAGAGVDFLVNTGQQPNQ